MTRILIIAAVCIFVSKALAESGDSVCQTEIDRREEASEKMQACLNGLTPQSPDGLCKTALNRFLKVATAAELCRQNHGVLDSQEGESGISSCGDCPPWRAKTLKEHDAVSNCLLLWKHPNKQNRQARQRCPQQLNQLQKALRKFKTEFGEEPRDN